MSGPPARPSAPWALAGGGAGSGVGFGGGGGVRAGQVVGTAGLVIGFAQSAGVAYRHPRRLVLPIWTGRAVGVSRSLRTICCVLRWIACDVCACP